MGKGKLTKNNGRIVFKVGGEKVDAIKRASIEKLSTQETRRLKKVDKSNPFSSLNSSSEVFSKLRELFPLTREEYIRGVLPPRKQVIELTVKEKRKIFEENINSEGTGLINLAVKQLVKLLINEKERNGERVSESEVKTMIRVAFNLVKSKFF